MDAKSSNRVTSHGKISDARINFIKICVVVAMILSVALPGYSQSHYASKVSLGVKGGADLSRMFFNPSVKQGLKPGAMFGVMLRYVEETHFGFIVELNYIQRGWQENFEEAPFSYSRTIDYMQLPVMAHIYFGRRGKFFVNVGPEFGVRLSDREKSNFDPANTENISNFPKNHRTLQYTEKVTQKLDYGICAGLGGEFNINPKNSIEIEARFYYGLGNLFGSSRKDNFNASNSMTLEFTLGYWFRIK